jgi:hypothetical protein
MIDLHLPTTDGRELLLTRYTEPEPELSLLLEKLNLELPAPGDDREDPSRVFRSEEADQDDLPRASGVAEGRAQGDPVAGDRVSL